jgi:hypothetical protein
MPFKGETHGEGRSVASTEPQPEGPDDLVLPPKRAPDRLIQAADLLIGAALISFWGFASYLVLGLFY